MNNSENLNSWIKDGCFEIEYVVPVSFSGINSLIRSVREAIEYQKCTQIKVILNSPGGEFGALQHYMWHLKKWRNLGVTIKTEGLVNVASAAAIMLALGEIGHRRVFPHTELVFHYARLSQVNALTAERASFLKESLDKVDGQILNLVSEHVLSAVDGSFPRETLQVGKTRFNAKTCKDKRELLTKIKNDLERLFNLDEPITAQQACQFYLVDEILQPTALEVTE